MFRSSRILPVMALAVGFATNARADDKKPEKPTADPGKPIIIQIDGSKLPPEVLKQLMQLAEKQGTPRGKPDGKPGFKPDLKPGEKPGSKRGEKPGIKTDLKPGEKPVEKSGFKQGEKPVEKPGLKPEVKPGEKPTEKLGVKPGSQDEVIQRLDKLSNQIEELRRSLKK